MHRYLDTSLLGALLVRGAGTEAAKAYLSGAGDDPLLVSRWTVTEFSSALALKQRMRVITEEERTAALGMFRRLAVGRLRVQEVGSSDFETAAVLCDDIDFPLRAGDALHVAVCQRLGARLATFDRALAHAASQRVPVDVPGET